MLIFTNIKFALSSLWDNKIRSTLTMLGVIIGVFSVITLISIGEGVREEFSKQVSDIGSNMVIVASGQIDTENESFNPTSLIGQSTLTLNDVNALKNQATNIEKIAWTINIAGQLEHESKINPSTINFATQPEVLDILNYDLLQGRNLSQEDLDTNARVVILGGGAAHYFFEEDENIINKKINLFNEEFTIIGKLEEKESAVGFGDTSFNNMVIFPFSTGKEIAENDKIFRILMKANSPDTVVSLADQTQQIISDQHEGNENFSVLTQEDLLGLFESFFGILTKAISGIASISLIVGGIGIMNIMLVSVTERTREIGIRKALGAQSSNILTQFLIEAATLSCLGGGIGVGLSFLAGIIITQKFDVPTNITLEGLLLSLIISISIGIIFGLMPAIKASQKNPIEALRHE